MDVAIIDSGIESIYVNDIEVGLNIYFNEKGEINVDNNINDENGHGTFIYKLLKRTCNNKNNYYIIKVLNNHKEGNYSILLKALKQVLDYDIKVVILCLATNTYTTDLEDIINEIYKRNIIIISSLKNNALKSYPAVLKQVFGVNGENFNCENFYIYNEEEIQITCSSSSLYSFNSEGKLLRFGGNSKAAALFAGLLINLLQDGDLQERVQEKVRIYSQKYIKKLDHNLGSVKISNELVEKCYKMTWHLHKKSYKHFISNSIWEMFEDLESMTEFVRTVSCNHEIRLQDIILHEKEFVCVNDMLRNVINTVQ